MGYLRVLLAIDPGKEHFGYAVFSDTLLTACGTPEHADPNALASIAIRLYDYYRRQPETRVTVAMEVPQNYLRARRIKSLEGLVALCAAVDEAVQVGRFYQPKMWKGQVPKPAHHRRLARVLTGVELDLWATADHNAKDAIGIGLFHLGRTKRGGIV